MSGSEFQRVLQDAARDRVSGAREITGHLLNALAEAARGGADLARSVKDVARVVAPEQPTMAPLLTTLDRLFHALDEGEGAAAAELERELTMHRASLSLVTDQALSFLEGAASVASLSWSSTVAAVLERLGGHPLDVVLAESRPGSEGRRTAARIRAIGHRVIFVADSAFPGVAARTDALLLGADALTPDLLVNKVGSRPAARECHAAGTPVHVLADPTKVLGADLALRLRIVDDGPDELWPEPPAGVTVENRHFETIPLELLSRICGIADETAPRAAVAQVVFRAASRHWKGVPLPERGRPLQP